ncbi:hypothetical protein Tsubulata_007633 [Turnera subulata]|uniref:RING-type E3 ubiquitin transferase n=1 Tax=Turnera subulata TaxID=218843 RepID=A0A9Q0JF15_9ROSI|nr:hypothetical protein Tsubulata_007633 [Turnera subulata]
MSRAMAGTEITAVEEVSTFPYVPPLTVAIAIDGRRRSKYLVEWALQKFMAEGKIFIKLLHVRPKITSVPTPMGNFIPISQVREDVASAYKKEMEWQITQKLLPCKNIITRRKVDVDIFFIESDDVVKAIAEEVARCHITKLVVGASSRSIFTRKLKGGNLSSRISVSAPNFCTVYAVSNGKLSSIRPSDSETSGSIRDDGSVASHITNTSSSSSSSSQADNSAISISSYFHTNSPSLPMQRFQALSTINQSLLHSRTNSIETIHSRCQSVDIEEEKETGDAYTGRLFIGRPVSESSSSKSFPTDYESWMSDQASISEVLTDCSSDSQVNINFELEKLRIELRHVRGIYAVAQSEAIDASRKLNDISKHRLEEATKLKELNDKEETAKELAKKEKERCEAAIREAEYMKACAEKEASQRQAIEIKATRDAKEKEKLQNAIVGAVQQYQKFTWEEIVSATLSFSESLKIGMGAYGTVYKCNLHHTTAAVKILHTEENCNTKQFQRELEVLSKIRHPHLLILLGACTDRGCLVYEYMENGSLEDRLRKLNNTPPIPWFDRFRIAWEVASALVFLHNCKPNSIVHRDLKPANILLDRNLVSKIGDVGLSTMLHSDASSVSAMFKDTGPVGTLCYIDPEYQRTGLVSPSSDVYAFGMVVLQLLTAKPAIALAHMMETAIDKDSLGEILDSEAGNWPLEETKELALLGLKCTELRRRDRPDLKEQVLPALERLKQKADGARDTISCVLPVPPNHFICPIVKEVMNDPCVAADGYTYDRKAIEKWLEDNDTSPMTNLPLSNRDLLPNFTLLSAILEWKSKNQ